MIELKLNELYILEGRIYRLIWTKWENGKTQGNRAMLKLLKQDELNDILVEKLKGGET
jgi:hypothetical protein